MSTACKIYYGVVVNEEGDDWARRGDKILEPVKVEGREPFGKSPEFCCKEFEEAWHRHLLNFDPPQNEILMREGYGQDSEVKVRFCPNCGAQIKLVEDLKLNVAKTTRTLTSYYLEKAA